MTAAMLLPEDVRRRKSTFGYFEDFYSYLTGGLLTSLAADSGTSVAASDAAGGVLVLTTGATDNNEAAVKGTQKNYLLAQDKPIIFECRAKYTEANTDDANVFLGMSSAAGANLMVDDGAGPAASFSGFGFYKIDGGTRWQVISSLGTTQTKTDLLASNNAFVLNGISRTTQTAGGGSYQHFRIEVRPIDSTRCEVTFLIDGLIVAQHDLTYTSAAAMCEVAYIKAGGANSEVLYVDWISPFQTR